MKEDEVDELHGENKNNMIHFCWKPHERSTRESNT